MIHKSKSLEELQLIWNGYKNIISGLTKKQQQIFIKHKDVQKEFLKIDFSNEYVTIRNINTKLFWFKNRELLKLRIRFEDGKRIVEFCGMDLTLLNKNNKLQES